MSQNISEKLINNAKEYAKNIIEVADKGQAAILRDFENELNNSAQKYFEKEILENKKILDQNQTMSKIKISNAILKIKQDLVDRVFNEAKKSILALADKAYLDFLEKLIVKYAENDDAVVFAKYDIKRIPKGFIDTLNLKSKLKLHVSEKTHDNEGGIILEGKSYDKNLTIDALINLIRFEKQTDIARILFNE
ncbi:MAG: V-type proton ATPase subunit E [Firmicutes bacterium]|nr:V-type proton ATPase subunit E [Bacillota bacterium]